VAGSAEESLPSPSEGGNTTKTDANGTVDFSIFAHEQPAIVIDRHIGILGVGVGVLKRGKPTGVVV
jgi:hypothetical protein